MRRDAYDENGFIDWPYILSFDAPYTIVCDVRSRGKTFGLRYQFIRDKVRRDKGFCELSRTAEAIKGDTALQRGYFDKFYREFPDDRVLKDWVCETRGHQAYIAKRPKDDAKPRWEEFGYFVALNEAEQIKSQSSRFKPVRRYLLDEALIDKTLPGARFRDYLPGEIHAVSSIMSSISRENPQTKDSDRPRLYLLGNAVDLTCPWLAHFGITDVPPYGFSWHYGGKCLLWYGKPDRDWAERQDDSVSGALIAGTNAAKSATLNTFATLDDSFFGDIPKGSNFAFGIVYKGASYGVWCDMMEGYYYVMPYLPKSTDNKPIYALTASDARPNYILARRAQRSLRGFVDLYYAGIVRYKDHATRAGFLDAMTLFGVR